MFSFSSPSLYSLSVGQAMLLRTLLLTLMNRTHHSHDYRISAATQLEILSLIDQLKRRIHKANAIALRQYLPAYMVTLDDVDFDVGRAICCLSPLGSACLQGPLLQHAFLSGKREQDAQDTRMIWEMIYSPELGVLPGETSSSALQHLTSTASQILQRYANRPDDGSIDMTSLSTPAGGDFNSSFNAHYWTPQKDTAERYREWAARRSPDSETCLIQIQVSNAFIERLRSAGIWFSAD
ncbi:hypothetical protein Aspvir_007634 [Aspergillus viridinutans]|uniref:Uncharacterized protein n=1 Tax=Aspergillus viridinutans TaxID=75553 RepID=A0A9P3BX15_ASPVI|nr:uncharacterized protein Aspvir_007634 [Aspergillus viridinutans]GIK03562.1 hypothetical protein Aspvir_007634 [Aspergillus viridinutans]